MPRPRTPTTATRRRSFGERGEGEGWSVAMAPVPPAAAAARIAERFRNSRRLKTSIGSSVWEKVALAAERLDGQLNRIAAAESIKSDEMASRAELASGGEPRQCSN